MGDTYDIKITVDGVIQNLWGMKAPNCVMKILATGRQILADETCKETVRRWKENGEDVVNNFKYKLPFDWNFRYLHGVYDHNNLRN